MVKREDQGANYMCQASNEVLNRNAIASVDLDVLCEFLLVNFSILSPVTCFVPSALHYENMIIVT